MTISMNPYRIPGKPTASYSVAQGNEHVVVTTEYGAYGSVRRVWPIEAYRNCHGCAPQDLIMSYPIKRRI